MTKKLTEMSQEELRDFLAEQRQAYEAVKAQGLKLDMSRGKPSADVQDQCSGLLGALEDIHDESGADVRNYGGLAGIPEARRLFGEILGVPASQVIMGGSSSLLLMFDTLVCGFVRGVGPDHRPWSQEPELKFLCPAPGYDRHFSLCKYFNIQMITVPMLAEGPDMDMVEALVKEDPAIKGIWCVPMYSNPDGITYSDEVVRRLAAMPTAAPDFRIYWDNAYVVHHLYPEQPDKLLNIYEACAAQGNEDRVYIFASTSKITFAGSGICAMAMSPANVEWALAQMNMQAICYDKVNQLRHCRYLPDLAAVEALMARHAQLLRPKFQAVQEILSQELDGLGIARWTQPRGGYFISFYAPPHCAKGVVELCREAGVVLTGAGATYPYGLDPQDSNIRIAPTYPPVDELRMAMELFCLAVKIASAEALLTA